MKLSFRVTLFGVFSLVFVLLNVGSIRRLFLFALDLSNKEASHILVVPFVSGALIWFNAKNIFRDVRWSVLPGILVGVLGGALLAAVSSTGAHINENDQLALLTLSLIVLWL